MTRTSRRLERIRAGDAYLPHDTAYVFPDHPGTRLDWYVVADNSIFGPYFEHQAMDKVKKLSAEMPLRVFLSPAVRGGVGEALSQIGILVAFASISLRAFDRF